MLEPPSPSLSSSPGRMQVNVDISTNVFLKLYFNGMLDFSRKMALFWINKMQKKVLQR